MAGTSEISAAEFDVYAGAAPLVLLHFPYEDIGTLAAKRLLARMRGDTAPASCTLLPALSRLPISGMTGT